MNTNIDSVPSSREVEIKTYEDLIESFKRGNPDSYKNNVSTLGSFLTSCRVDKTAKPGPEFGADYEVKVSAFLSHFENNGTRDNNKSRLKALKNLWDAICSSKAQGQFHVFHEAFTYYFNAAKQRDSKLTHGSLAKKLDCKSEALRSFTTVIQPNPSSFELIRKLEKELGTREGALTLFVKSGDSPFSRSLENKLCTEYRNKLSALRRHPYSLRKEEITEDFKNDFHLFFNFKTDLMVSPLERNETWTLRPAERFSSCREWEREFCSTKANDLGETRCAPTAAKRFELCRRVFGALKEQVDQNGDHLYDPKKFRFVWLAEKKLVNTAIDFFHNRMGQYTATAKELIKFSVGLLLPKVGYVRQHPEFGLQLLPPVVVVPPPHKDGQDDPKSEWERWCDDQLKELKLLLEGLTKRHDIKRARDPKVPIKEILDRVQPISALFELSTNMREYLDTHPLLRASWAVVLERDYLLARLITVQPLRINMFKIMTYRKDNSGNLYRRVDGTWAIRFKPEDFKNLNNDDESEDPYDVPLSDESIGRDIERFINQIRTKFKDDSDRVFVAYDKGRKVKGRLTANLSVAFTARTRQFLKDSIGFGPHAVRHIVVTDFLKHNPGKYQVAADMLHDKVATVIANYAHLAAADGHKFYQEYLAGMQPVLVEKQSFGTPELREAILANLNNNKTGIPADLRALLNKLTNPEGKVA